jgi:hypothetical protein
MIGLNEVLILMMKYFPKTYPEFLSYDFPRVGGFGMNRRVVYNLSLESSAMGIGS